MTKEEWYDIIMKLSDEESDERIKEMKNIFKKLLTSIERCGIIARHC